jgi:hypothetical protein
MSLGRVGVWLLEAIELHWERETELKLENESGTKSKSNNCSKIMSPWGCLCGSFYRGGHGSHYNALNTLNHLPCQ